MKSKIKTNQKILMKGIIVLLSLILIISIILTVNYNKKEGISSTFNGFRKLLYGENNIKPELVINPENSNINIDYEIYKVRNSVPTKITNFLDTTYFKNEDTVRIEFTVDKYLYTALNKGEEVQITNEADISQFPLVYISSMNYAAIPQETETIVENDNGNITTKLVYEYKVNNKDLTSTPNIYIDFTKDLATNSLYLYYSQSSNFYTNDKITGKGTISSMPICLDGITPLIKTTITPYINDEIDIRASNTYPVGTELIITATTTEEINDITTNPIVTVYFGNDGENIVGKSNGGVATYLEKKTENGKTVWKYSYNITEGDKGKVYVQYSNCTITDIAGNIKNVSEIEKYKDEKIIADTVSPTPNIIAQGLVGNTKKVVPIEQNRTNCSILRFVISFDENVEVISNEAINITSSFGQLGLLQKDTEKSYYIDVRSEVEIGNQETITLTIPEGMFIDYAGNSNIEQTKSVIVDKSAPTVDISCKVENYNNGKPIRLYTFKFSEAVTGFDISKINVNNGTKGTFTIGENNTYTLVVSADNKDVQTVTINDENIKNAAGNILIPNSISVKNEPPIADIVISKYGDGIDENYTNTDNGSITATFKWSSDVIEFDENDIIITNGSKVEFEEKNANTYKLKIMTNVIPGNIGDVKISIESGTCMDLVGNQNTKCEKIITIDRKTPILQSIQAYTESGINVDKDTSAVKENYKVGDIITISAIFNEAIIESNTNLSLQFSKSGEAKGEIIKQGGDNKVIYKYAIVSGDEGTLSIKGFDGTVKDYAGNIAEVAKKELDGNTIIADTINPQLQELNVITDAGIYKSNSIIQIEARYSEGIYAFKDDQIKNINIDINSDNAPILLIKFANGQTRRATAVGYGKKEDNTIDKTKILYSYEIYDLDNGELGIVGYFKNNDNDVCDISGNICELNVNQTGNIIKADTTAPIVNSITATVETPSIANTVGYYKEGNIVDITITFSEKVIDAFDEPAVIINFFENENSVPSAHYAEQIEYSEDGKKVYYQYVIQDGDNGDLLLKIPSGQFLDEAGNGNIETSVTKIENIYADTMAPTVTLNSNTEVVQIGQTITVTAEFSEDVYDLNENSREILLVANAPKLIYSFGNGNNKEIAAKSISGKEIIYEIIKDAFNDDGDFEYALAKGNLCDRAGNNYYEHTIDTTAPILEKVEIGYGEKVEGRMNFKLGDTDKILKAGELVVIKAVFNEEIKNSDMDLIIGYGNLTSQIKGIVNEDNQKELIFSHIVSEEQNGSLEILDVYGNNKEDNTLEDNTYGYVSDYCGNGKQIFNLNNITNIEGQVIVDTTAPYVTNITVKKAGEISEIATYNDENGEKTTSVGRTNADKLEYIITFSEPVNLNAEDITITNGIITEVNTNSINIYYSDTWILTVTPTFEGVQSLIIRNGSFIDYAGNDNEAIRFNGVTVDYTVPTVRFISEYNGGTYVIPTNIGKVEIRPNIEVSEDISKVEYKWNEDVEYITVNNYSSSSDISIPTRAFTNENAGENILYVKVTDLAGNENVSTKLYNILNSNINISRDYDTYTNEDITVTVEFEEGLTDNRKVTFKEKETEQITELNATGKDINGNTQYKISKNGTVYAEATDRIGNKVFTSHDITNIDKTAPTISASINGGNVVIGTGKTTTTIKTTVNVEEDNLKEMKYAFTQANVEILNNMTAGQLKSNLEIQFLDLENYEEVKIENAESGTYYLYVIATDSAGNETLFKSNEFKITNSNEIKNESGETIFTPADADTIKFERVNQKVTVSFGDNLSGNQEIKLINDKDGYIYENTVEVLKPTTITASAEDICGNKVEKIFEVTNVTGPEFEVIGNPENWTNQNAKLTVSCNIKLAEVKVNNTPIINQENEPYNYVVNQNGDYTFVVKDEYGNIATKIISVTKIDKTAPNITGAVSNKKVITITATDNLSGIKEYAVTETTEVPVEWSDSNTITTTKDGVFYVWAKDNAGNIKMYANTVIVDTTAPTIMFNNATTHVTVGTAINATITTDEDAKISYNWNNSTWTESTEYVRSIKAEKTPTTAGTYTLYAKATDKASNTSTVQTLEFTIVNKEIEIESPEIVFEDLTTVQIDGVKYVKISNGMVITDVTNKMNSTALHGTTPVYTNLTSDNKLKTGSEIKINGVTKYVVVVNGDVNCDGKVTFLGDIVMINNYRIGINRDLSKLQILAGDVNNNGTIEFIPDIVAMNNYRLGRIKVL